MSQSRTISLVEAASNTARSEAKEPHSPQVQAR
jgi:hypothetical protein